MGHLTPYQIGRFLWRVIVISAVVLAAIFLLFFTQDFWLSPLVALVSGAETKWNSFKELPPSLGQVGWFIKEAGFWLKQGPKILYAPGPLLVNLDILSLGLAWGILSTYHTGSRKPSKWLVVLLPVMLTATAIIIAATPKIDPIAAPAFAVAALASAWVVVLFLLRSH